MTTMKPLRQEDFPIELIKDQGMLYPKESSKRRRRYAIFKCIDCGLNHSKPVDSVRKGSTKCQSCAMVKHHGIGHKHRLYGKWASMKRRCFDENAHNYANYGGRGITVEDDLMNFTTYVEHLESLPNCYEPTYTVDRIDNDGNYTIGNLRWATKSEQALNRRKRLAGNVSPVTD